MRNVCEKTSNIIYLTEVRRRVRRERLGWFLESCACVAVILMAAAFTLRVLL